MNINKLQGVVTQEEFQQITTRPLPTPEELFESLSRFHSILYDALGCL